MLESQNQSKRWKKNKKNFFLRQEEEEEDTWLFTPISVYLLLNHSQWFSWTQTQKISFHFTLFKRTSLLQRIQLKPTSKDEPNYHTDQSIDFSSLQKTKILGERNERGNPTSFYYLKQESFFFLRLYKILTVNFSKNYQNTRCDSYRFIQFGYWFVR